MQPQFGTKWIDLRAFFSIFSAMTMSGILNTLFSYFEDVSPWFALVPGIPPTLCGGGFAFVTVANSYISEQTSDKTRALR